MSYTLQNHPARIESSIAGESSSLSVSLNRTPHAPFVLLSGITGAIHSAPLDPITTVLDQTTYDALAVKPKIVSVPRSGLLLELSVLYHSDKTTGNLGLTGSAPVVRLFGVSPPAVGHPRRLGNVTQIESGSWFTSPSSPYDQAVFTPLMSVAAAGSSSAGVTLSKVPAFAHVSGGVLYGETESVQVYLAGADAVVALLEVAATVDQTASSTAHLKARVIDA